MVVEDGSSVPCEKIVNRYQGKLDIHYYNKPNSGPGQTRNYGAERSNGEYLIILDSDCILPEGYLDAVEKELQTAPADAFGGPDRAHSSFTDIQKAINYSMTSFFTTGGIRGGKKKMDKFYPRSFNMGVRREVYQALGGFSNMRFGEDIDFSIRIFKGGYQCRLFPDAWVYHKRRTDFKKFFKQVHNSVLHVSISTKISRIVESRPFAAGCIHVRSCTSTIMHSLLLVQPRPDSALCLTGLPGFCAAKQKLTHRHLFHRCFFHPTYRIRHRILACLVGTLYTGKERI